MSDGPWKFFGNTGERERERERENKFIGLFEDRGHQGPYSPYKPFNHNLYIGNTGAHCCPKLAFMPQNVNLFLRNLEFYNQNIV